MSTTVASIKIGTASASAVHAADLGKIIFLDGKTYRMCKAGAAVATAASKVLSVTITAGVPTWVVQPGLTPIVNDFVVVPEGQTGSTGTTGLVSGDYFYAQVSGPCVFLTASIANVKTTGVILKGSSLGTVKAYTVAGLVGMRQLNTAAATAVGRPVKGFLTGLC